MLLGDRAYKIKKPVDLGFLDFRTEAARAAACQREYELNKRLAPDVYLDVDTVRSSAGVVTDHVLVMRRMPDELRLASLAEHGLPCEDPTFRALARLIASFRKGQARPAHRGRGRRDRLASTMEGQPPRDRDLCRQRHPRSDFGRMPTWPCPTSSDGCRCSSNGRPPVYTSTGMEI